MKKFAKMSLVAALAVAGTTASAQPLTEAIKNVDVSGSVVYRYNDYNNDEKASQSTSNNSANNNYKIAMTAKAKVNDDVTAVTRFIIGSDTNGGFTSLDTEEKADGQVSVTLSNVYFSYTGIANTTVNVGKQGLTTPWTVAIDSDSEEQTGTGILALTNVGPVTLAAAYFNQTNLDTAPAKIAGVGTVGDLLNGADDVYTFAAMGNIGPVALDAWYLDMEDKFDTYTIGANAKFDISSVKLGIDARYTSLDFDNEFSALDTQKLWYVKLTAKAGIFDAKVGYAGTDKDGGLVALDNDAKTAYQTWNMNPNGKFDADFYNVSLGLQALESLHISANYTDMSYTEADGTTDVDEDELYAQFDYKMSKNFKGYIRYGTYDLDSDENDDDIDGTRGRLQLEYSF